MIVKKIETDRIIAEAENGLIYTPLNQAYKIVECACADLKYIEEAEEKTDHIAEMLIM